MSIFDIVSVRMTYEIGRLASFGERLALVRRRRRAAVGRVTLALVGWMVVGLFVVALVVSYIAGF
jgi:high-affinity nickel permease